MQSILSAVRIWGEMVKFSHSVFALPFALIAAFLAGRNLPAGVPSWGQLGLIVVCMVAARSAAMTFNRIVDAQIDARNPRTAGRPLPTGRLSLSAAWLMLGLSIMTFGFGCLGFFVFYRNAWPIVLAGPILIYVCGYSFAKRFTRWSHFYLGSAIALSPVAAWLVVDPSSLGWPAVLLMLVVTCWIGGFDILYACQDIEVDRTEGLHSLPSRIGPKKALFVARLAHAIVAVGLVTLGYFAHLGLIYAAGVAVAIGLLIVQNALVRPDDYGHVNLAFFTLNGVISFVLAITVVADVLVHRYV